MARFDAAAQQFQVIRQAQAQENTDLSPQARSAYEHMQGLWARMGNAESGMMHSMRGRGTMGRFGMGGRMMSGPMMTEFNEMNQQMLSYCLGMQQIMQQAGNGSMASMYVQMAERMRGLLASLPPSAGTAPAAPNSAPPVTDGAATFAADCAGCHGAGGEGVAGAFPPLRGTSAINGAKATLAEIVLHGLQGPVTVAGQRYDGFMPGLGGTMSDAEIAAVLTYARSLPGNQGGAVTAADVHSVRMQTASRSDAFTGSGLGLD